jgi:hypothetical protein
LGANYAEGKVLKTVNVKKFHLSNSPYKKKTISTVKTGSGEAILVE